MWVCAAAVAAGLARVEVAVSDPAGRPAPPGTEVALLRGGERVVARPEGEGFVAEVPPGDWTVEVRWPGDAPVRQALRVGEDGARTAIVVAPPAEEVTVGGLSAGEALARSAEAVTVVDTAADRARSADLGEVLARAQGVGVRRSGGLGSEAQVSLAGLGGEQVRLFLDGVPLDLAGWPGGLAAVPVDLVARAEVYRGVVPVRFGADALGGAVNLVSRLPESAGGSVSLEAGAYDTVRATALVEGRARGGLSARATGAFDATRNDFLVDVEVPDDVGRLSPARVRRFHDAYRAGSGALELGVVGRPWADVLSVRAFGAGARQELQHNVVMTVPYGRARTWTSTAGASGRWLASPADAVETELVAGYTSVVRNFVDRGRCVVDWFGRCVAERAQPGEIVPGGVRQVVWDDAAVVRARATVTLHPRHALTLAVAPTVFSRAGRDLLNRAGRDPLTAQRDATTVVSGLEHVAVAGRDRLENRAFVKHYFQALRSEEPILGGGFERADRTTSRFGVGDGARLALGPWARLKASGELATRLPTPEEVFGDGVLVVDNLALGPERSLNANLGFAADRAETPAGGWRVGAEGFLRSAEDLVVLLGADRSFSYVNVFGARSAGVEAAAGWTAPRGVLALDANGTWLSLRNTSADGPFADFAGDRIPNRPWAFANATASVGGSGLAADGDRLSLDLAVRYVHAFWRGWESVGLQTFKQEVPSQLSQTVAVVYAVGGDRADVTASLEVQNLSDARLYDLFGVQRPGRSAFGKIAVSW